MSIFASSSRLTLPSLSLPWLGSTRQLSGAHRYVKGKPNKLKLPKIRSPYQQPSTLKRPPVTDPGSSSSSDAAASGWSETSPFIPSPRTDFGWRPSAFTSLENSSLQLHHSPPASAPSYTTGNVPDLVNWLGGESVRLSGEERAPLARKLGQDLREQTLAVKSDQPLCAEIKRLRSIGLSRSKIVKRLGLPDDYRLVISAIAPESAEQAAKREALAERVTDKMSYSKRLAREVRARRKEFW
ncbi:hypothetical protein BD324DRAFT_654450 [Kockovaella imperatae]|uniref:Mitochondrial ribosomal protein subunit L20-domain-containing protein n=1 Tax=Kockovaella imperatae TaxID=4999 RepID=A0A1Y1UU24_9TREE|nr:hypothetical protein BD324DRAFT_654450 [Kockovaella imperatae]ORX40685.1 hypothetical protein BD324DRAFT_654450 [Kockovaella imperatae]